MIDRRKQTITHVNATSKFNIQVDELVSSYEQVNKISKALASNFLAQKHSNKVVINLTD